MTMMSPLQVITLLALLSASAAQAQWALVEPLRTARTGHTMTELLDGRVLVTGGWSGSQCTNTAEVFDPALGTWSTTGTMSIARCHHAAVLVDDGSGRVFVTGGLSANNTYLASTEFFNPSTNSFSSNIGDNMRNPRAYHASVRLARGDVLVIGGYNGAYLASVEQYRVDTATSPWNPVGDLKVARANHTATMLPNDRILIVGGVSNNTDVSTGEFCSNLVFCTWVFTVNGLAVPRNGHTATLLSNGDLLITGGTSNGAVTGSTELYDNTRFNEITATLGTARFNHAAVRLLDGQVLVVGGQSGTSATAYLDSIEIYNPTQRRWTRGGLGSAMEVARAESGAVLLFNGRVLVAGGTTTRAQVSNTVEIYDASAIMNEDRVVPK